MADVVISEFMDEPTANKLIADYDVVWDPKLWSKRSELLKEVNSAENTRVASSGSRQLKSLPVYRPKLPNQSARVSQKILNQQADRVALQRPKRDSENIQVNRNQGNSRLR